MKNRNKIGTVILGAALLLGSTFAYFTDSDTQSLTAKAGKVELGTVTFVADSDELLVPGSQRAYTLDVENLSDVDTKVRYTYVVDHDKDLTLGSELDFKVGAETGSIVDGNLVIVVDGNKADTDVLSLDVSDELGNEYQETNMTITALVELLQDENTSEESWITASKSTIEVGNLSPINIVPAK